MFFFCTQGSSCYFHPNRISTPSVNTKIPRLVAWCAIQKRHYWNRESLIATSFVVSEIVYYQFSSLRWNLPAAFAVCSDYVLSAESSKQIAFFDGNLPIKYFIMPLEKRFRFHFYVSEKTSLVEKVSEIRRFLLACDLSWAVRRPTFGRRTNWWWWSFAVRGRNKSQMRTLRVRNGRVRDDRRRFTWFVSWTLWT